MLDSQKLELRQSEIRSEMAELQQAPELNDEGQKKLDGLLKEYRGNESKYQAAKLIEDAQRAAEEPKDTETRAFEDLCAEFRIDAVVEAGDAKRALEGREAEVSQGLEKRFGKPRNGGVMVPHEALMERRNVTQSDTANLAERPQLPTVERFFEQSVSAQFGIRPISVTGQPRIPQIDSGAAAAWVAEGAAATAGDITTSTESPAIKTVHARYIVSRQALRENTMLQPILQRDLQSVIVEAVDKAAFQGAGASNQPSGLATVLTGARTIAVDDVASFSLIMQHARRLLETSKGANFGSIMVAGAPILGSTLIDSLVSGTAVSELERLEKMFRFLFSQQVSDRGAEDGTEKGASNVYLHAQGGDGWMLNWGAAEVLVDPYSLSANSQTAINVWSFVDFAFMRTASHWLELTGVQDRA